MMWGKHKENGFWLASRWRCRFLFRNHDSLFVAFGRFRMRIMKPGGIWFDNVSGKVDLCHQLLR